MDKILFIAFALLCFSCQEEQMNSRKSMGLKGNVKEVRINTLTTWSDGTINERWGEYKFRENGMLESYANSNDHYTEYDEKGRILKDDNSPFFFSIFVYEEREGTSIGKGLCWMKQNISKPDVYCYNERNQLVFYICNSDTTKYFYDKDGKLISERRINPYYGEDELGECNYTYNKEGLIVREDSWGGTWEYTYDAFDEQGNWTKRTGFFDGEGGTQRSEENQHIVYWEEKEQ